MPLIKNHNCKSTSTLRKSAGFTLLEVLVAMVIFSIGLLGLASLQGQSLEFSHGAYLKSQGTFYAYDVLDKMRANRVVAIGGSYNATTSSTGTDRGCYDDTGNCSATDMALHDIFDWKQLLTSLPAGNGSVVSFPSATTTVFEVTVSWDDANSADGSGRESIKVRSEL